MNVDFSAIQTSQLLSSTETIGFRDPAAIFYGGRCYLYYTHVELDADGWTYMRVGLSISDDLVHWEPPRLLTPRDRRLNYSSPGCVLQIGNEFVMCLQTYPTCGNPAGNHFGNASSRIYLTRSRDLLSWSQPELMRVHGDGVSEAEMGRMIDPYIAEDVRRKGHYRVFYKQHPKGVPHERTPQGYPVEYMSFSSTDDLQHFRYEGYTRCGENVCVLPVQDGYRIYHSPQNGIGCLKTHDFLTFEEEPPLTLGQSAWPWASARLTAGFVLDGTMEPGVHRYLLFFHGDTPHSFPFSASLGMAWSRDLNHWEYR